MVLVWGVVLFFIRPLLLSLILSGRFGVAVFLMRLYLLPVFFDRLFVVGLVCFFFLCLSKKNQTATYHRLRIFSLLWGLGYFRCCLFVQVFFRSFIYFCLAGWSTLA